MQIADKFSKPFVEIKFDSNFEFQEEFLKKLMEIRIFSIMNFDKDYYKKFARFLLREEDPEKYILSHEPILEGMQITQIFASSLQTEKDIEGYFFFYNNSITDEKFKERIFEIAEDLKMKHSKTIDSMNGWNFYKKYVKKNEKEIKELADAYFYFKDHENAIKYYEKIKQNYKEYSIRMASISNLFIQKPILESEINIDIFYLMNNINVILKILRDCNTDLRRSLEYWLQKQPISYSLKMLFVYKSYMESKIIGSTKLSNQLFDSLNFLCKEKLKKSSKFEQNFLENLISKLEKTKSVEYK